MVSGSNCERSRPAIHAAGRSRTDSRNQSLPRSASARLLPRSAPCPARPSRRTPACELRSGRPA
eukprot:2629058-Pyramimonas_sp.AAC.1